MPAAGPPHPPGRGSRSIPSSRQEPKVPLRGKFPNVVLYNVKVAALIGVIAEAVQNRPLRTVAYAYCQQCEPGRGTGPPSGRPQPVARAAAATVVPSASTASPTRLARASAGKHRAAGPRDGQREADQGEHGPDQGEPFVAAQELHATYPYPAQPPPPPPRPPGLLPPLFLLLSRSRRPH